MSDSEKNSPNSASARPVVIGVLLLAVLPMTFYGFRGEIDRWRAASVIERYVDGDRDSSLRELEKLTERLPRDYRLKLRLAGWLLEDRQAGKALEVLDLIPEDYRDDQSLRTMRNCLLSLGRSEEALLAYRDANPANDPRTQAETISHKNELAYYQALASTELGLALQNCNEVVAYVEGFWNYQQQFQMPAHLQTLFCAAMVYRFELMRYPNDLKRQRECAAMATDLLSDGIASLEQSYKRITIQINHDQMIQVFDRLFDGENTDQIKRLPMRVEEKEAAAGALAAFRTVRALIYQSLEMDQASFRDRRSVIELGLDPEKVADMLPSFFDCTNQLLYLGTYLDTRGCVFHKQDKQSHALADLESAVIAQRSLVEVAVNLPRTGFQTSLDPRQQEEILVRQPRKTLATLLYHCSWVRRADGNLKAAELDENEIRALGFEPDDYLF